MIRKTSKGYVVVSESGKHLSQDDLSLEEAKKRLQQVEFFKRWSDGKKDGGGD